MLLNIVEQIGIIYGMFFQLNYVLFHLMQTLAFMLKIMKRLLVLF